MGLEIRDEIHYKKAGKGKGSTYWTTLWQIYKKITLYLLLYTIIIIEKPVYKF